MTNFVTRLVQVRAARPLVTSEVLVAQTGIPAGRIAAFETGEAEPTLAEVVSLAWALDCWVAELGEHDPVADRLAFSHQANDPGSTAMRAALVDFARLNDYLDEWQVPSRPARSVTVS